MAGQRFEELVEEHRRNRTLYQLEADSGGVVRWNSWQQWTNPSPNRRRTQFPQVDTVRAMAAALGVTNREVVLALSRTLGLEVESDEDLVIPHAGRLGPMARATMLSLGVTLLAAQEKEEGTERPFEVAGTR